MCIRDRASTARIIGLICIGLFALFMILGFLLVGASAFSA